jgi:hypothetical protein
MQPLSGILLLAGLLLCLYLLLKPANPNSAKLPHMRDKLGKNPSREDIINAAHTMWRGRAVPLGNNGAITAGIGNGRYVWRDGAGQNRIICAKCALALLDKAYSSEKRPMMSSAGMVHGMSPLDAARMELATFNFYSSHRYELYPRGGFRAVDAEMPRLPCELPHPEA